MLPPCARQCMLGRDEDEGPEKFPYLVDRVVQMTLT